MYTRYAILVPGPFAALTSRAMRKAARQGGDPVKEGAYLYIRDRPSRVKPTPHRKLYRALITPQPSASAPPPYPPSPTADPDRSARNARRPLLAGR